MSDALKDQLLQSAKRLFLTHGYDAVGMRDIAKAVGLQPVQVYRLDLSKSDILAEIIIELNEAQIRQLPELRARISDASLVEMVCAYFHELYVLDIQYLPIRSVGAAYGWLWSGTYEEKIISQVMQLLQPVVEWMREAGLTQIEARGFGIWSVYYVGFRRAVVNGGNADDCIQMIRPTLEVLLGKVRHTERCDCNTNKVAPS
ncbi:MAG: hypothetical protein C0406_07095 [Sideroxydans sp.]|nr:hypothetical protein [Sideroxydans sp.]